MDAAHEREQLRLGYIWKSIALIDRYTQGGKDAFLRERMVQDAVLRRLETLADAAEKLSDALKARHPDIPWRRVYRFRNVAAHAYETIDLEQVWDVVQHHLTPLKAAVEAELAKIPVDRDRDA
jgi:uncharacterized protein with HEPN domain